MEYLVSTRTKRIPFRYSYIPNLREMLSEKTYLLTDSERAGCEKKWLEIEIFLIVRDRIRRMIRDREMTLEYARQSIGEDRETIITIETKKDYTTKQTEELIVINGRLKVRLIAFPVKIRGLIERYTTIEGVNFNHLSITIKKDESKRI